jgi:hypothetical protein
MPTTGQSHFSRSKDPAGTPHAARVLFFVSEPHRFWWLYCFEPMSAITPGHSNYKYTKRFDIARSRIPIRLVPEKVASRNQGTNCDSTHTELRMPKERTP